MFIESDIVAPIIVPTMAPDSNMDANLMFVILFFIYINDELFEVTRTPKKLVAMARCIGISNNKFSPGTIMNPPPRPNNEPINPAKLDNINTDKKYTVSNTP